MNPRPIWQQRPLFCMAIFYSTGIWLGARFDIGVPSLIGLALSLMLLILLNVAKLRVIFGILCVAVFTGSLFGGFAAHPVLPAEGKYFVEATVSGESELTPDGRVRAILSGIVLTDADGKQSKVKKAYWTYIPEDMSLPIDGQTAQFVGSLYHPSGQVNPLGFDFRMYLLQKGITVGISGMKDLVLDPIRQTQPDSLILKARNGISTRFEVLFGDTAELAKALLIGERSGLSQDVQAAFQGAGIAYILAISGQHIVMLMTLALFIIKPFRTSAKVTFVVILVLLIIYCTFLDFPPSVVRAAISMAIFLYGHVRRRRNDMLTTLSASFLLILIINPLDLFSVGFQLSFSAVAGIILVGDRLKHLCVPLYRHLNSRVGKQLIDGLILSISATTGVILPLIYIFHRFSWIGVLISPLACALVGVLMTGYIMTAILSLFSLPAALFLAKPINWLAGSFMQGTTFFGKLPFVEIDMPVPATSILLALIVCILLLTRYICADARKKILAGCAVLVIAIGVSQAVIEYSVRYILLSVGDADSAIIEDGETTYVVDTGEYGGDLAAYILSSGRHIDHLLLSHLHSDHTQGLEQLLDREVKIDEILLPEGYDINEIPEASGLLLQRALQSGIPVRTLSAGDIIRSERVSIKVLWPVSGTVRAGRDLNDCSMMLMCDLDGIMLLSTGDVSVTYDQYSAQPAQILKVSHHGSRDSTSAAFLDVVSPEIALVSAEKSRGESVYELEERLWERGAVLYRTYNSGALTLTVKDKQVSIQAFLP